MVSDKTAVAKLVAELAKQSGRSVKGWASPYPHEGVLFDRERETGWPNSEFNHTEEKDP